MTNEEKAKRTYPYFEDMNDIEIVQTNAKRVGFIDGCKWKDEQLAKEKQALIDKACEWLSNNIAHYTDTQNDSEGYLCEVILEDALIGDFRKAMEGDEK